MSEPVEKMSWGQRQRLEFIEFRLFWDGRINRSDLVDKFAVSIPQASTDLSQYRELAPDNIRYDPKERRYEPTVSFRPILLKPNAERYLAQLKAVAEDVIDASDAWFAELPNVGITPIPSRRVEPQILRQFLEVIRSKRSVSILYQSMNEQRPDPLWRAITPHAFGSDGLRWHLRAYCHIEKKFKDFIISRCLQIGDMGDPSIDLVEDVAWSTFFDVVLIPNPKLSAPQQKTIELDYGMQDGQCVVPVRRALLYYFDKRLRLDVAEKHDRPKETPIIVANRLEYNRALGELLY
jgi:predicted DNA-binding transcriptional regulator YafY